MSDGSGGDAFSAGDSILSVLRPEVLANEDDHAVFRFRSRPELTIPGGGVQGGIVSAVPMND